MKASGRVESTISQAGRVSNTKPTGPDGTNTYIPKDDDFSRFNLIENSQSHVLSLSTCNSTNYAKCSRRSETCRIYYFRL